MEDDYPRLQRKNRGDDDPKMIGLWKVGRTIGKGSSGRVRIARHSKTGKYAAVKIVSKHVLMNSVNKLADSAEHMLLSIEREIVIMKLIDHPNIMRLYDVWETSTDLYLILEYVEGGELFDYLCNKGQLSAFEALGYFQQIISAVDYCHRFNIAHRDLKPENLLMDKDKNIKVADFGMAAWQASTNNGLLQTACGSPHYAAPEVIMGKEYNGCSSDIWSCGVILFALLAGRLPFDDEDLATLLEKVKSGRFDMPTSIDPMAKDLISKMLQRDVENRITIPQILEHPFFLSREPKIIHQNMPDLDAIARPIGREEDIDQDIFANLQTLWHGALEQDILDSLKSNTPNWKKGVYHLLIQYRSKHLENYEEEEEMMARAKKKSRKTSSSNGKERLDMARTTSQATDLGWSPSMLPPRAAPPTPRRAGRGNIDDEYLHVDAPQITLHLPTPPRPGTGMHSPSPSRYSSPSLPLSPNLPTITVPDIKDDKMQQFFQQIVEHLNAMEMHTGIASGSPQLRSRHHPGGTSAPPSTPVSMESAKQRQQIMRHELSIHRGQFGELDKENANYLSVNGPGIMKKSSLRNNDTESRRPPLRVQIIEPSPRKLRKKSFETTTPTAVSPAWSDSSFTLPSTPRRRWLGNVFKFKPASYQLLSVHDRFTSREECRRLLVGIGMKVILTHAEGNGVLKCRFDEVRDPAGVLAVIKAARFRVEIRTATTQQAMAGFQVALHLIQERGTSSSFQMACQRLRSVWELDLMRAPAEGSGNTSDLHNDASSIVVVLQRSIHSHNGASKARWQLR
ncbi:Pkinase-domain-containing protein [Gyrodon lividus]|nr:Pkinase-domain-containing protein [Gyrodon lividus]